MIFSPYATRLTRMIQNNEPNPDRDYTNRRTLERPLRYARWLAKQSEKKKAA